MDLSYKEIGMRIRSERIKQNISQEKLAELADLSTPHISHIETANTKLSLPAIVKIANALNISVDSLLCDSVKSSSHIFKSEIAAMISSCDDEEIRIAADILKAALDSIRKNRKKEI